MNEFSPKAETNDMELPRTMERSHCSLFLHLTAVPSSATGGGTAARPGTLRVPGLHIIRSKAKTKRHP